MKFPHLQNFARFLRFFPFLPSFFGRFSSLSPCGRTSVDMRRAAKRRGQAPCGKRGAKAPSAGGLVLLKAIFLGLTKVPFGEYIFFSRVLKQILGAFGCKTSGSKRMPGPGENS